MGSAKLTFWKISLVGFGLELGRVISGKKYYMRIYLPIVVLATGAVILAFCKHLQAQFKQCWNKLFSREGKKTQHGKSDYSNCFFLSWTFCRNWSKWRRYYLSSAALMFWSSHRSREYSSFSCIWLLGKKKQRSGANQRGKAETYEKLRTHVEGEKIGSCVAWMMFKRKVEYKSIHFLL